MKRAIAIGAAAVALVFALGGCGHAARAHDAGTSTGGTVATRTTAPAGKTATPAATTSPAATTAPAGPIDLSAVDKALAGIDGSMTGIDLNITDADKAADNDE